MLTFTPANALTPQTVTVTAVDDAWVEGPHVGTITHTSSSGDTNYHGLAIPALTVNITDNDAARLTVDDVTGMEADGLLFTVTLDNAVPGPFDVIVTFVDVTATGGSTPLVSPDDYANDPLTLVFSGAAGEMQQFVVTTLGDTLSDSNETFTVNLSATDPQVDDTDTATGTIVDANMPPTLVVPGQQTVVEDTSFVVSGISVSDADAGGTDIQLSLWVLQGTLHVNDTVVGGLAATDVIGNGSSSVVLTGSVAEINATLMAANGLSYQAAFDYAGSDTLTIVANDLGNTGAGGPQTVQNVIAIVVTEVNDPPILTAGVINDLTVPAGSGTTSLGLAGLTYAPGGGGDESTQTLTYAVTSVPPSTLGEIVLSDGVTIVAPGTYSLAELQGMQFRAATGAYGGPGSFDFGVTDNGTTAGVSDPLVDNQSLTIRVSSPFLRTGVVSNVTNTNWTTVSLDRTFASMVVVLTANHSGAIPLVTRMRNANLNSSTFEIRVDRVDGLTSPIAGVDVHYVVVDEGTYNLTDHGITMEAVRYTSTVTDSRSSWQGEQRSYGNTYTSPVVIGQVMSYNDPDFSVFWSRGATRAVGPNSADLYVGKHVGEDPDTDRFAETVGYLVFESGAGSIDSVQYTAQLGPDTVRGVVDSPPYTYTTSGVQYPVSALVSQSGVDGVDGSWAMLFGSNPLSSNSVSLAVDEDQLGDAERKHTTERVAYVVFGATGASNAPPVLTAPATLNAIEDTPLGVAGIGVTDADAGTAAIQLTLSVSNGTLTVNDTVAGGLSAGAITGNGSSSATLFGTIAEINSTLADTSGLTYQGNADFYGNDDLIIYASDLANTGLGGPQTDLKTVSISVSSANDAPINQVPGPQSVNEDTPLVFSSSNGNSISISDADAAFADMRITMTATHGRISLNATTGLSFLSGDGTDDSQVMFSGTLADINNAINGIVFTPDPDYFGIALLELDSNDLGNTGGGPQMATDSIMIDIAAVNDAPIISLPATQNTPLNTPLAFVAGVNPISIDDVDAAVARSKSR